MLAGLSRSDLLQDTGSLLSLRDHLDVLTDGIWNQSGCEWQWRKQGKKQHWRVCPGTSTATEGGWAEDGVRVVSQKLRKHESKAAGRLVGLLEEQSAGSTSSKAQARLSGVKR